MKKEELSDAIGNIDEDLIDEAAQKRVKHDAVPKRKPIYAWVAGFTAAAAAIAAIAVIPRINGGNVEVGGSETSVTSAVTEDTTVITTAATEAPVTQTTGAAPAASVLTADDPLRARPASSVVAGVSALNTVGDRIAANSMLKINVYGDVSEETLRSHISLNGGGEFTLTRSDDQSYLLAADSDFGLGEVVRLAVSDDTGSICDSYAFPTVREFAVKSVYPADGTGGAGINTGVEIEFTAKPDISDAAEYFRISPDIEGEFREANDRLIFTHSEPFDVMQTYTVTLRAGFPAADGQTLAEDCVFSFGVSPGTNDSYFYTRSSNSGFSETFIPGDRACVEIYCSGSLRNREYDLHLYSFGSADSYRKALLSHLDGKKTVDTGALEEVYHSTEKPFCREDENSEWSRPPVYALLPEELAEGYYVADISVTGLGNIEYSLQYMVAVTPLSVYSLSLGEENLFFVNDPVTGKPAAGATVTLEAGGRSYSGITDSDGLARIVSGGETGKALVDIKYGSSRYTDVIVLSDAENIKYDDLYYTYIYTDRELYNTTDSIKVWGLIIPKTYSTGLPSEMYLELGDPGTGGDTQTVTVGRDGTFTAEFSFKNHVGEYTDISLKSGEDIISRKGVFIFDYDKPEYILDVTVPEYAVLPQYEPFTAELRASYYEGTPAEGVIFSVEGGDPEYVTTDSDGYASSAITMTDRSWNDWRLGSAYANVQLSGIENVYIHSYKWLNAFYRDVMLRYKLDEKNNLTIYTNEIDFSKIDEYFEKRDTEEYKDKNAYLIMKGEPTETEVSVRITHSWTDAVETGSYYDYLEKKTVKRYQYFNRSTQVAAYRLTTEEGKFTLYGLPFVAEHGEYTVYLVYNDLHGAPVELSFSVTKSDIGGTGSFVTDEGYIIPKNSQQIYYSLKAGNTEGIPTFSENEDIPFALKCTNAEAPLSGRLLLTLYRSDITEYRVFDLDDSGTASITATDALIPDARFEGAFFDGKHIYKVQGGTIRFDPSGRELSIEAFSDSEKYDAGDTAAVTVRVTDTDGRPVGGATVLLSCADEAAFAVMDQTADVLDGIYSFVYYPAATTNISYIQHFSNEEFEGGKGGGGGDDVRRDFRDTAYFASAVTAADGTAVFNVKLPDNLTTWRSTILAVYNAGSGRLLAGTEKLPLIVSRDVMINPIMQTQYTEGDDIAVSAKCAGLPAGGSITVTLTGGGTQKETTIKPQETANFGKLPAGSYTVTFRTDGDAMEKRITVTDTLLETDIVRGLELEDLQSGISPTRYPVTVAFFNKEYMLSTQIMQSLARYCGNNLGMRLAAAYAEMKLGYLTEEELCDEFLPETSSGLAKELPAANYDTELTALMCAAYPDAVNRESVIPVMRTRSTEYTVDMTERCAAHMALAALGEPILGETKELLASGEVSGTEAGIYLAAAMAFCGDYEGAYDTYIKYVPKVTFDDSDPDAVLAYVDARWLTSAAIIPASLLDLPEAEGFARYLIGSEPVYGSFGLQLVTYLEHYIPHKGGEAVFTYTLDGQEKEVRLGRHYPTIIRFTEAQFKEANFRTISGSIYAAAKYVGRITENPEVPTLSVKKELSGTPEPGEKVTVSIRTAPYSIVYDVIPSCGRLSRTPGMYYNVSGQIIKLYADKDGNASYEFTVNVSGEFTVSSAVAVDANTGAWGLSSGEQSLRSSGRSA